VRDSDETVSEKSGTLHPKNRAATAHLRPGLLSVGSIMLRDKETLFARLDDRPEAYQSAIAPRKAWLERWYAAHQSFEPHLMLIELTVLAVIRAGFDKACRLPGLPFEPTEFAALRACGSAPAKTRPQLVSLLHEGTQAEPFSGGLR
jgi:hypothetical protein